MNLAPEADTGEAKPCAWGAGMSFPVRRPKGYIRCNKYFSRRFLYSRRKFGHDQPAKKETPPDAAFVYVQRGKFRQGRLRNRDVRVIGWVAFHPGIVHAGHVVLVTHRALRGGVGVRRRRVEGGVESRVGGASAGGAIDVVSGNGILRAGWRAPCEINHVGLAGSTQADDRRPAP